MGKVVLWGETFAGTPPVLADIDAVYLQLDSSDFQVAYIVDSGGQVTVYDPEWNDIIPLDTFAPGWVGETMVSIHGMYGMTADGRVLMAYPGAPDNLVSFSPGFVVEKIATCSSTIIAIGTDHTVEAKCAWGSSPLVTDIPVGLLATDASLNDNTAVAVTTDGGLVAWGYDDGDLMSTLPSVSTAVKVAVGYRHALALLVDGTVIGWGENDNGQLDVPEGLVATDIAAGKRHSIALRADGSIVGWVAG